MTETDPHDAPLARTLVALADRAAADLRATDDVALAQRAARLGRRRLRTRTALRTTGALVAAGALAVAGVQLFAYQLQRLPVVGGLVPVPSSREQPTRLSSYDPYAHFMDEPARGTLAGDKALQQKAFAAWATAKDVSANRGRGIFDDLRGEPHLVWAGDTPTGPAAVVAQDAYLHPHEDLSPEHVGPQTLIGFVTTGRDGGLHLTADDYGPDDGQSAAGRVSGLVGVWLDGQRSRLLVVDPGYPLSWSTAWRYHPDGSVTRDWRPVTPDDGAAVLVMPAGADPDAVRVARPPATDYFDVQRIAPEQSDGDTGHLQASQEAQLPWAVDRRCVRTAASTVDEARCDQWQAALYEARQALVAPGASTTSSLGGVVVGSTPDGRTFVVGPLVIDHDPGHLVAGVFRGDDPATATAGPLVDPFPTAGPFDPAAPLPVAVRLPDAQGWVVAAVGSTLRYRTASGDPWQDAGTDAALLPDTDRLEVEVTPAGGGPTVVVLGG